MKGSHPAEGKLKTQGLQTQSVETASSTAPKARGPHLTHFSTV